MNTKALILIFVGYVIFGFGTFTLGIRVGENWGIATGYAQGMKTEKSDNVREIICGADQPQCKVQCTYHL